MSITNLQYRILKVMIIPATAELAPLILTPMTKKIPAFFLHGSQPSWFSPWDGVTSSQSDLGLIFGSSSAGVTCTNDSSQFWIGSRFSAVAALLCFAMVSLKERKCYEVYLYCRTECIERIMVPLLVPYVSNFDRSNLFKYVPEAGHQHLHLSVIFCVRHANNAASE